MVPPADALRRSLLAPNLRAFEDLHARNWSTRFADPRGPHLHGLQALQPNFTFAGGEGRPRNIVQNAKYNTLGVLKLMQDPSYEPLAHCYYQVVFSATTRDWHMLQGGCSQRATFMILALFETLELDDRAIRNYFLLAQAGDVGRALANQLLWNLLTGPAMHPDHLDLSAWTTTFAKLQRQRYLDRPPRSHKDLQHWDWTHHYYLHHNLCRWARCRVPAPASVDHTPWYIGELSDGAPMAPPRCFGAGRREWQGN